MDVDGLEVWDSLSRQWVTLEDARGSVPGGGYYFQRLRGSAALVADNVTLFVPPNVVQDGSSALNWESNRLTFERSGHTVKGGLVVRPSPRTKKTLAQ